jgi:hypothetical protein
MMRRVGALLLLTAAFSLGTQWGEWWAVPVIGFASGLLLRRPAIPPVMVAMLAALAWGLLLLSNAARASTFEVYAGRLATTLGGEPWMLLVATLVLPALLAGSAAALGRVLVERPPERPASRADGAAGRTRPG